MDQRVTKVFGGALRAEIPYRTNSYSTSHGSDSLNTGRPSIKNLTCPYISDKAHKGPRYFQMF